MKQTKTSAKIVKGIFLAIGIFLLLTSGAFNDLSTESPNTIKSLLGSLFIVIALFKRVRLFIKETFDC